MRTARITTLACAAALAAPLAMAANPFDAFKGQMKEGMYEYKMDMDMGQMPGMPAGMGKQSMSFQRCITQQDIEKGQMGRGGRDGKMPEGCEVKNFSSSGNTATYTMTCTQPQQMTADNKITFTGNGFNMDMKMNMTTSNGKVMNTATHMEAKYLGACSK